jgi:hypothetical protein
MEFDLLLQDMLLSPLLDRVEEAAVQARVPSQPSEIQLRLMCNLWSRFDLIKHGESPIIACCARTFS